MTLHGPEDPAETARWEHDKRRRVRTQAERDADGHAWYCGAFQPNPPRRMKPYRCTEPSDHAGNHRAVLDGEVVAEWHRLTRREL